MKQWAGIKTYRQYVQEHRYKLKKIIQLEKQMTLHHLIHRSEGGHTSEHNGAVVNSLAHGYLHSLPRHQEEIINNMLREYKKCDVILSDDINIDFEIKAAEISFSDEIQHNKKPFNRAKEKQQFRKRIIEEMEER